MGALGPPGERKLTDAPLKILVVHARYRQYGGEDAVVDAEMALLRSRGHSVDFMEHHNSAVTSQHPARAAVRAMWSAAAAAEVKSRIADFSPDVVHVHNTFPLLSPSIHWAAHAAGVAVVQTLHNFRLFCAQAMLMRDGAPCQACLGRSPWRAAAFACYRDSRAQSAVAAASIQLHRSMGTWQRKVTRFIALSEFARDMFVQAGLPADRIIVKPNFAAASATPLDASLLRRDFLFVGRLSPEKGLSHLIQAYLALGETRHRLLIIGDGPERANIPEHPRVVQLGQLSREAVARHMRDALALVVPSIWPEMFGLVAIEALAEGTPVIASRIGALTDIVEDGINGWLVAPGQPAELTRVMRAVSLDESDAPRMRLAAQRSQADRYGPAQNARQLEAIYREAVGAQQG